MLSYFGSGSLDEDSLEISEELIEAFVDLVGTGGMLNGEIVGFFPLVEIPFSLVVEGVVVVESSSANFNVVESEVSG